MEEDTVDPRRVEHDGVRGDFSLRPAEAAREVFTHRADPFGDQPAQWIVADLRHQAHRQPESVQG